jgi:[ribosomal protein S18]-alanine N-acetyltransferase
LLTRDAAPADVAVVATWIGSARECERWAGSRLPYPLQLDRLPEQLDMDMAISLVVVDDEGLAAFGQVLPVEPERAHLARLIVRPDARGTGVGRALCRALLHRAVEAGLSSATLYVRRDNAEAVRLYESLGFRRAVDPARHTSAETWFMRRSLLTPP